MERTLQGAFNEFVLYHQYERNSRPKTVRWHEKNYEAFNNYVRQLYKQDDPPLSSFSEDNIRQYLIHRVKDDKVSTRTQLWHWQSYRAFARFCMMRKFIKQDPFACLPRPKVERKTITYLQEDEIKAIMRYMSSRRSRGYYLAYLRNLCLIATLVYTGIRRGEALGLKVGDVDLVNNIIRLNTTKVREKQTQPIPSVLRPIMKNYIDYRKRFDRPNDDLFVSVNRSGYDKRRGTGAFGERGLQLLFGEINANVKLSHKLTPH